MIAQSGDPLFSQGSVDELLRNYLQAMRNEASQLSAEYILNNSIDTVCGRLVEKYTVAVPTIKDTPQDIQQGATEELKIPVNSYGRILQVDGTRYRFYVPFDGDAAFLRVHGSPFSLSFPKAIVNLRKSELCFVFETHDATATQIQEALEGQLRLARDFMDKMRAPASEHNRALPDEARAIIEARLSNLRASQATVTQLPYRRRNGGSDGETG